jgi:aminoglycoside phosphotransferase (APT) family kinase protein
MHDDELATDPALVRRLLEEQFPLWADLSIIAVPSAGTDNVLYRLGGELVARLPRLPSDGQVAKEWRWLPRLAPRLPVEVPVPLALGEPGAGYPMRWSVCRWLEGEPVARERLTNLSQAARDLAAFILALRGIDPAGGPLHGAHNFGRGEPLAARDADVRESLAALRLALPNDFDWDVAAAAWDESLNAPAWDGPPLWLHGDLYAANLLAQDGRLSAVIDFGGLGVDDPACDLMVAWNLFTGESRAAFRAALAPDEASWLRGRGWALSMSLIALPYYLHTNPAMVALSRNTITEILGDNHRGA